MKVIRCNLCKSENHQQLYNVKGYNIVKCVECGLVFINPQPTPEEIQEVYANQQIVFNGAGESGLNDYLNRKDTMVKVLGYDGRLFGIEKHVNKGKILDIGCAAGFFLDYARSKGWDACGIEISPWAREIAQLQLGLNIFNKTLKELAFPDNHFDVITMYDVLEHTADPLSELQEVFRVLKPGGLLVLNLPNINSLLARINKSNWLKLDPPQHLYHFTPETISRMVNSVGFKVEELATNNGTSGELSFQLVTGAVTSLSEQSMSGFVKFYRRHKKYLKWLNTSVRKTTDGIGLIIGLPAKFLISKFNFGEGMILYCKKTG